MSFDTGSYDDPEKSLKKRQKKTLEFTAAASARDSLLLLEPTIQSNSNELHQSKHNNSFKNDDLYTKLTAMLIDNGFDEYYLINLKNTLIDLQDESNRQRAARNLGDFDFNEIKRILYTPEQKMKILDVYNTFHNHAIPACNVFNYIRSINGYEKVSSSVIYRWKQSPSELQPVIRTGRPINTAFEHEVVNEAVRIVASELNLLKQSPDDNDEGEIYYLSTRNDLLRAANVDNRSSGLDKSSGTSKEFHTYRIMRLAATVVHERYYEASKSDTLILNRDGSLEAGGLVQKWKNNAQTARLAFSNKWIQSVLARNDLHNWDIRKALLSPQESTKRVSPGAKGAQKGKGSVARVLLTTVSAAGYSSVTNEVRAVSEVVEKIAIVSQSTGDVDSSSSSSSSSSNSSSTARAESLVAPMALSPDQFNLVQQVWVAVVCQVKTDKALLSPGPHGTPGFKRPRPSASAGDDSDDNLMPDMQQQYQGAEHLFQQNTAGIGSAGMGHHQHQQQHQHQHQQQQQYMSDSDEGEGDVRS